MELNFGYVANDGALEFGYSGAYTGGTQYPYELTSHGAAHPNSVMASANFATTGTVELRIVSDFDSAKISVDWQAMSDGQLWRQDIKTLDAVTVNATEDTTDSATIGWRTPTGDTGEFAVTVNITDGVLVVIGVPSLRAIGFRKAIRAATRNAVGSSIH